MASNKKKAKLGETRGKRESKKEEQKLRRRERNQRGQKKKGSRQGAESGETRSWCGKNSPKSPYNIENPTVERKCSESTGELDWRGSNEFLCQNQKKKKTLKEKKHGTRGRWEGRGQKVTPLNVGGKANHKQKRKWGAQLHGTKRGTETVERQEKPRCP